MAFSTHRKSYFDFSRIEVAGRLTGNDGIASNIAQWIVFYHQVFDHILINRFSDYYNQRIKSLTDELPKLLEENAKAIVSRNKDSIEDMKDCLDEAFSILKVGGPNETNSLSLCLEKLFLLNPVLREEVTSATKYIMAYLDTHLLRMSMGEPNSDLDLTITNVLYIRNMKARDSALAL